MSRGFSGNKLWVTKAANTANRGWVSSRQKNMKTDLHKQCYKIQNGKIWVEEIIMSSWFNSNKEPLIFSKVSNSDLKLDETQCVHLAFLMLSKWTGYCDCLNGRHPTSHELIDHTHKTSKISKYITSDKKFVVTLHVLLAPCFG